MSNYIDLHMHSFYSDDGQYSEEELISKCNDAGLKIVAIADHNSVKANAKAKEECAKYKIEFIPAIEIDCVYEGINLHLLGYGIDYENPIFNKIGEDILKQEFENNQKKLELTNALGFEVSKQDMDKVSPLGSYIGEGFAEVLLNDDRYIDSELLKPYREGGSRSDNPYVNFYWDYYSQGKPCYTEVKYISLRDAIDIVHKNHGKAILAHPGNNLKGRFEIFDEMVELGLDGVEAFSSYHSMEVCMYFYKKAKQLGIYTTCGSDFHGKTKPSIYLGKNNSDDYQGEIEQNLKEMGLI